MGKLAGLLGAGIGLAVEVSRSHSQSQLAGQTRDGAIQEPRSSTSSPNQAPSETQRPNSFAGYPERDHEAYAGSRQMQQSSRISPPQWHSSDKQNGDSFRSNHGGQGMAFDTIDDDRTYGFAKQHHEEYHDTTYDEQRHMSVNERNRWQNDQKDETTAGSEPPSYAAATHSTEISLHSRPWPREDPEDSYQIFGGMQPQKTMDRPHSDSQSDRNASIPAGQGLQLPVIVPQRRPEDKSRGWMLCYAPMLESCDISQTAFLEFLTSFNESSKSSPYLDAVNVAALGVGFAPGIAPMIVSAVVPMAVSYAKTAQTNAQTKSYLGRANDTLFSPRGLFAMVVTFKPESASKTLSINSSSPLDVVRQHGASRIHQPDRSDSKDHPNNTYSGVELPASAPLIFPSPAEVPTQDKNGLQRTFHVAADYFDRRARATYVAKHPEAQMIVGPTQDFKSPWGDPNSAVYSGGLKGLVTGGLTTSSKSNDEARKRERYARHPRKMEREAHKEERETGDRGGLIKTAKSKMMQKDMLYLMIVNSTPSH